MPLPRKNAGRRSGRYDFHAERVRQRVLWEIFIFAVFTLAGAAAVFAVITMFNR